MQEYSLSAQFKQEADKLEEQLLASILNAPDIKEAIEQLDRTEAGDQAYWQHRKDDYLYVLDTLSDGKIPYGIKLDAEPTYKIEELARQFVDMRKRQMYAAQKEKEMAKLRRTDVPIEDVLGETEEGIARFQRTFQGAKYGKIVTARQLLPSYMAKLDDGYAARSKQGEFAFALPTGFELLDKALGSGLRRGIHMLAAGPGAGKSALALQIARNVASSGFPVVYLSLEEDPEEDQLPKVLSSYGNLNQAMFKHYLTNSEKVTQIVDQHDTNNHKWLDNLHFIGMDADPTVYSVKVAAQRMMQKANKDRCLIIIDYLQIFAHSLKGKYYNDYSEFRHVVGNLAAQIRKHLAFGLNSPVLVISSQNRTNQGRSTLTSLKESGELEYGADSVWFITCEDEDSYEETPEVILSLEKNRHGRKVKIKYRFHKHKAYYEELGIVKGGNGQ